MQFCNEQTRTQSLFSPACASATYDSARMCRRKNMSVCTFGWIKAWTPIGWSDFDYFFKWFHGLGKLLIDGPPRTDTDHPTISHGWTVGPGGGGYSSSSQPGRLGRTPWPQNSTCVAVVEKGGSKFYKDPPMLEMGVNYLHQYEKSAGKGVKNLQF